MFTISLQFVNPSKSRQIKLREAFEKGHEVAEAVPEITLGDSERLLVLLCFKKRGSVSHICWGRKGQRAGTALSRLNFERIKEIKPIDTEVLMTDADFAPFASFFQFSATRRTGQEADELVRLLRARFPEINAFIEQSIADYALIDGLTTHQEQIVSFQHDATEMALRVAGIISRQSYIWSPSAQGQQQVSNFFSGLAPHQLLEDDIIRWDLTRIPGFKVIHEQPHGYCVLEGRGQKLHVFHANKNDLEHTLGVDLIYFNEAHRSFVFIQYKGTEKQGNTEIFRFPDGQLTAELDRMDAAWGAVSTTAGMSSGDYRLISNPFFLKFCPRTEFDPDQYEQIKGMIIPREYWSLIESDSTDQYGGPKGGKFLSFENCPKYMDNTFFISVLQEGWIGTGANLSSVLEKIIAEVVSQKHSVILAAKLKEKGLDGVPVRRRRGPKRKSGKKRKARTSK